MVVHLVVFSIQNQSFLDGLIHLLVQHVLLVFHVFQVGLEGVFLDLRLIVL